MSIQRTVAFPFTYMTPINRTLLSLSDIDCSQNVIESVSKKARDAHECILRAPMLDIEIAYELPVLLHAIHG